jgi:alanyl-tRNA synthetase
MAQTSDQVRRAFLEYFREHEHEVVSSGPLIPANDPTLLFANAGMVQFKDVFTGREKRAYCRATSSQKCIRISGKHNDLEAVGPSPRHHTFFEMLGNFSFGDYFKEQAIVLAWDFLTKTLGIPAERMIFTYFGGEGSLPADVQARDLWKKVSGFGDDRVRGLGMAENFWQMGETGPCGPCSEIHYHNGGIADLDAFGQEQTVEGRGWMELWNLVFMQFERSIVDGQTRLEPLPAPSIDTGAGLERVSGVVQGKLSNYDVDLLCELVNYTAELAGKRYGASMSPDDVSLRVIADHARTTAFLMAEGLLPDRNGREYVLRRVMRRAVRHGHRLGMTEPFLHRVALKVVQLMGTQYPELASHSELIASISEQEEQRFRQTIERGLGILEERFVQLQQASSRLLGGADAFQLYDTFGFPLDLTQVICGERGIEVDVAGYEAALEEARARSEFAGVARAVEQVYRNALERVPAGAVKFLGYEQARAEATVVALILDGSFVTEASAGSEVEIVVDQTPFYGESGGQVGDQGHISAGDALVLIDDTHKPISGLWVHHGRVEKGMLRVADRVTLQVDTARRDAIRRSHSATHLLHLALHRTLGEHATQKGSVVGPDRLRFDFTHDRAITDEQLQRIEQLVNERVFSNTPVRTEILTMAEARTRGAMMIFEEKYGEVVRMLSMAESVELCGGTHARATGDIGMFKILSEGAIAAGVRRITAVTGFGALGYTRELQERLSQAAQAAKAAPADLVDKVSKLVERQRQLEKQVDELERKLATAGGGGLQALLSSARDIGGVKVLAARTEVRDRGALRELAEQLCQKLGNAIVLLGSVADGKAQLVCMVSESLTDRYSANALIKSAAEFVGGTGGGRPDLAQAGGTQPEKLDQALQSLYAAVSRISNLS